MLPIWRVLFYRTQAFNQPLNDWNVQSVETMVAMFYGATDFQQNIRMWDVSNVSNYLSMFHGATGMFSFYNGVSGFGNTPISSFFNQGYTHNGEQFTKPAFKTLPSTTATEDSLYSHQVVIVDDLSYIQPAPTIDIALTQSSPDWLSITNNTLSGTPLQAQVGQLNQVTLETYISGHQDVPNAKVTKTFNISVNEPVLSKDTTTGIVKLNSFYYTTDINGNNPTIKSEYDYILHTDDLNPVEHQIPGDTKKYRIINDKNKISDDFKGDSTAVDYNYVTTLVTDMNDLFRYKSSFNRNISSWDVSKVKSMSFMFNGTTSFNQNIGNWDVSKVTTMYAMFEENHSINH